MSINMECIGTRIKKRRKELQLTQTDIKKICGISSGSLSEIENGNRTPSIIIFYELSRALKCSMDWLVTGVSSNTENAFFSSSEEILFKGFRQLGRDDQDEIMGLLELKLRKIKRDNEKMARSSNSKIDEHNEKLA